MCVDVCGDVCVMCVCVVEMQAMAPMTPKCYSTALHQWLCKASYHNRDIIIYHFKNLRDQIAIILCWTKVVFHSKILSKT